MVSARRASRGFAGVVALAACVGVAALLSTALQAFVVGTASTSRAPRVTLYAEGSAPSPAPASVALVKVNEENAVTTAGVLGGVVGLLLGGIWVGGALFVASSYLARKKDDDVAKALQGVATGSLEALNFAAYVDGKYSVTGKLGSAIGEAVDGAAKSPDTKETVSSIAGALTPIGDAIKNFDKEVGIKDSLGNILTAGGELANQLVSKAIELNKEYKVTDKIAEKIQEVTKN